MFNLLIATSQESLQTIKNTYHNFWCKYDSTLEIENIYKIWFYKNNNNNEIIKCRIYYKINKIAPPDHGSSQFYNVIFYFNTNSSEYIYKYPTENMKIAYYNDCGLNDNELNQLVLFYPIIESKVNNIIFSTIPINRKLIYEHTIDLNIPILQKELLEYKDLYSKELKYKNNTLNLDQWSFFPIISCHEQSNSIDTMPLPNFDRLNWDYKSDFIKICKNTYQVLEDIKNKYNFVLEYYDVFYSKLKKNTEIPMHMDKNTTKDGVCENYLSIDHLYRPFIEKQGAVRIHIPIITKDLIYFDISDLSGKTYTYNFITGNLYFVRAVDRFHGVRNNSDIDRFHIVIDAKPSNKLLELID